MRLSNSSLVCAALAASLSAQGAYVIDADQDRLYGINLGTGQVTNMGSTLNSNLTTPADLCWRDETRQIYTIDQDGGEIGTIDPLTALFTITATTGISGWEAMAWDHTERVFWLQLGSDELWRHDPVAGTTTQVGVFGTNGRLVTGLEVDAQGNLYGVVPAFGAFISIDKTTAQSSVLYLSGASGFEGMAFDAQGVLYAVESTGDALYLIDSGTGLASLIGPMVGTTNVKGLVITDTEFQRGGRGCPAGDGVLWTMDWAGSSALGQVMQVGVGQQATVAVGFVLFSFDNELLEGIPLPIDATPIGAPGCVLYVGNDMLFFTATGALITFSIPVDSVFVGLTMYSQGVLADQSLSPANPLGLVVSDFARVVITN